MFLGLGFGTIVFRFRVYDFSVRNNIITAQPRRHQFVVLIKKITISGSTIPAEGHQI